MWVYVRVSAGCHDRTILGYEGMLQFMGCSAPLCWIYNSIAHSTCQQICMQLVVPKSLQNL